MIQHLVIIGVGLIGGSLARALKASGKVERISGIGRNRQHLERARELGVIDTAHTGFEVVAGADLVVLATPVGCMEALLGKLAPHLGPDTVITDAGSVKTTVVDAARAQLGEEKFPRFVPGHPIAGTERSGVEASFAELFEAHRVVLTPAPETATAAVDTARAMWEATGAEVVQMDAASHDRIFAETSHLPHLLAFALVDCLAQLEDRHEIFEFAAGGFRDFTRIASSDPVMWRDICVANALPLGATLERLQAQLARAARAIQSGDGDWLEDSFARAKAARDGLLPADVLDSTE
ncbi:MAG: prephenate dehydrogenase/arogenate dehydrogenase family protein [Gammaproteobacteria bacterium]|nr:prephenate dehydrogenase/arogenate dehydrogenase family protein [Gammaproteobacteria bacterium]